MTVNRDTHTRPLAATVALSRVVRLATPTIVVAAAQSILLALTLLRGEEHAVTSGVVSLGIAALLGWALFASNRRLLIIGVTMSAGIVLALIALAATPRPFKGLGLIVQDLLPDLSQNVDFSVSQNTIGYLLASGTASSVGAMVSARSPALKIVWALIVLGGVVEVTLTGASLSAAGLAVGITVVVALAMPRSRRTPFVFAVATIFLIAYTSGGVFSDPSVLVRLRTWAYALWLVTDPLAGLGFGAFAHLQSGPSATVIDVDVPINAHSLYVQTYVDFGIVGLLVLIIAVAASLRVALEGCRSLERRGISLAALGGLCSFLVCGLGESVFTTATPWNGSPLSLYVPILFVLLVLPAERGIQRQDASARD